MTSGARLHVVTGKGGTGKSTVAASLALTLAAGGNRVLLVEVEGRQGIAQLFDTAPLPYEERKVAVAPGGGDVFGLAVDPYQAVLEYLEMYYRLGRAGKVLDRLGALEFATTIAPGLRDVLLTGKTYEAVRRRATGGGFHYDAVVLDAPPTGRVGRFLNVNEEVQTLARVGPIHRQARSIMEMLRSRTTLIHLVTILEEMPVQETLDAAEELGNANLPIGGIIVNQVERSPLSDDVRARALDGEQDPAGLSEGLKAAGLPRSKGVLSGLTGEIVNHARRVELQADELRRLEAAGHPLVALPRLTEGVELGGMYRLARRLGSGVEW